MADYRTRRRQQRMAAYRTIDDALQREKREREKASKHPRMMSKGEFVRRWKERKEVEA